MNWSNNNRANEASLQSFPLWFYNLKLSVFFKLRGYQELETPDRSAYSQELKWDLAAAGNLNSCVAGQQFRIECYVSAYNVSCATHILLCNSPT